jgi:tRNA-splicing ligase RtcB (3'-phosphate/5'-hydroxy nucleic acid ligase)
VPIRRHRDRTGRDDLPFELNPRALSSGGLSNRARRDGLVQLGTLGGGNHFLEMQTDDEGALWLMVHSGSRAMGQAVAGHHMKRCETEASGLRYLVADSPAGREYVSDQEWARGYAHQNRLDMVDAVAALLEERFDVAMDDDSMISCDHNHVRQERHDGASYWVHRKGALSAQEGELGLIPGSMGTESFHTEGRGCAASLMSSSHGAGRAMSRTEAKRRISTKELNRQMRGVWFDRAAAARLRDEAPGAYKDVGTVMRAQRELTRIVRRVRPLLVFKG